MKEKILAFLKGKLPQIQLAVLDGVAEQYSKTITDEANIESAFTDPVIEAIKTSGAMVDSFSTKRANDKVSEYEKKHNLKDGKPVTTPTPPTPPANDEPAWFKTYREKSEAEINSLRESLAAKEAAQTRETLSKSVLDKVRGGFENDKDKELFEAWFDGRKVSIESADDIDSVVESINSGYTSFKQKYTDAGVMIDVPSNGQGPVSDTQSLANQITEGTKKIVEQSKTN